MVNTMIPVESLNVTSKEGLIEFTQILMLKNLENKKIVLLKTLEKLFNSSSTDSYITFYDFEDVLKSIGIEKKSIPTEDHFELEDKHFNDSTYYNNGKKGQEKNYSKDMELMIEAIKGYHHETISDNTMKSYIESLDYMKICPNNYRIIDKKYVYTFNKRMCTLDLCNNGINGEICEACVSGILCDGAELISECDINNSLDGQFTFQIEKRITDIILSLKSRLQELETQDTRTFVNQILNICQRKKEK